jgi:hypothetical protein
MKQNGRWAAWLVSGLLLGLSARQLVADVPADAYLGIAGSNVFRLRSPLLEPGPPPAPLPKVTPVGITTILNDKRALLRVSFPAHPPEPAKEVSCILTVGQREGPIEILGIDESAGSVKLNNSGTVMVLTLAQDGPRLQSQPPAPSPLQVPSPARLPPPPPRPFQ